LSHAARRGACALAAACAWLSAGAAPAAAPAEAPAAYALEPLPYALDALEPAVSAKTLEFHYGKHHRGYVDALNRVIAGTAWAGLPLEKVLAASAGAPDGAAVFNNAAQAWNHAFFWRCMKPGGGGKPAGRLLESLERAFGSFDRFKAEFSAAGLAQFGSGWVWLVQEADGGLAIVKTANADTPAARGGHPLLVCDVWEHAYYLDYQNRRGDFVQAFLEHLANWDFAASRLR